MPERLTAVQRCCPSRHLSLKEHLLAHRLRGFGPHEGSLASLRAALAEQARFVEIDTRVTADGEILVFHDSRLDKLTRAQGPVMTYSVRENGRPVYRGDPTTEVPVLEEFLGEFLRHGGNAQLLIDIKDLTALGRQIDLIREANILSRTWLVSWSPEILLAAHEMEPELRLSFSHIALTKASRPFRTLVALANVLRLHILLGRLSALLGIESNLQDVTLHLDQYTTATDDSSQIDGRFTVHFLGGIPDGRLGHALRNSGGSVGIWAPFLTEAYAKAVHREGLLLFVFTIDRIAGIDRAVRQCGADVVFTNNAKLFRHGCRKPRD